MSYIIEGAKPSPRILNGNIYWYEGDTFSFPIVIDIFDELGYKKKLAEGETVALNFFNSAGTMMFFKNVAIAENNTIQFEITDTETVNFPAGRYRMNILYGSIDGRETIADDVRIVVE